MNRIKSKFQQLKELGETALVGFVTAGDPDIDKSLEIVKGMCTAGLDILELGIPFSDPTADGPVIQRSSSRSLAAGTTLPKVLAMTEKVRSETDIPIILFSYYNPIFAYGVEKFYNDALKAGADGVLIVDLPPEEANELTKYFINDDFSLIKLIAPTTSKSRMKYIAESASGFLYLVSKTGVTGSDGLNTTSIETISNQLCSLSKIPVCIGFGISTNDDVTEISKYADGVVIGSAFERTIETNIDNADLVSLITNQVKEYKNATKK